MAKKKIIRRNSKSINLKTPNYFDYGGDLIKAIQGDGKNTLNLKDAFSGANMGGMIKGSLGAIGTTIGTTGGGLIGGGLKSGAGNAVSGIGSAVGGVVSAVNPLLGGIISAGTGLLGGLTNRMFGSKLNEGKINEINATNDALNNTIVGAGSNDSIMNQWLSQDFGQSFDKSDIGKDGWFSHKASNKYKQLQLNQDVARTRAIASYDNAIDTVDKNMYFNALSNYAAYGGPLMVHTATMSPFGNRFDDGGNLGSHGADWSNGVTIINNGGTHEENPNEGVQMGVDEGGTPNLVEEGEVKWNNYIFSNRLGTNKEMLESAYLPTTMADHSFAAVAEKLNKESAERPNDPISKRGLDASLTRLATIQESLRQREEEMKTKKLQKNIHALGGNLYHTGGPTIPFMLEDTPYDWEKNSPTYIGQAGKDWGTIAPEITVPYGVEKTKYVSPYSKNNNIVKSKATIPVAKKVASSPVKNEVNPLTALRYAPIFGSGVAALSDAFGWTNKPDYSEADRVGNAVQHLQRVGYQPSGDYLTYNPFDVNFYQAKLDAQAGATRRNIINQSGGNRANAVAGLLAADYNAQGKIGDLAKQAEEYNQGLKERVATFNRGTNQFNSEQGMRADVANQSLDRLRYEAAVQQAQMRDQIGSRAAAARSANLSNFFSNLGNVGTEIDQRQWIRNNPAFLYDDRGYKGAKAAKGGYLNIGKRRK